MSGQIFGQHINNWIRSVLQHEHQISILDTVTTEVQKLHLGLHFAQTPNRQNYLMHIPGDTSPTRGDILLFQDYLRRYERFHLL